MESLPNYDSWKLASPDEKEEEVCRCCGGEGELWEHGGPDLDDLVVLCETCEGTGVV